mmetsp:Transcript_10701/g.23694  ORF Transcript_10701/g.23694 Transcript_10701/m.23694 type:complete len:230 (+) Transcript_10701:1626-2315(+)
MGQLARLVHLKTQTLIDLSQMNGRSIRNQTNKLIIMLAIILGVISKRPQSIQKVSNQIIRQLLNLQIFGQIDKYGSRPPIPSNVKGIIHDERHLGSGLDLITPLGHRSHDLHRRTTLEGILGRSGRCLTTEDNEGDPITHGIRNGRHQVRRPRSTRRNDNPSGQHAILSLRRTLGNPLGNMPGRTFIRIRNPSNLLAIPMSWMAVMELIQQWQNGPTRIPIDYLGAVFE